MGPPGSEQPLHIAWGEGGGHLTHPLPFQMIIYLTFPVAMFWVSNQAEWFEGYVIQRKVGIRGVFEGSLQGWERVRGTNLLGTNVCLP